MGREVNLMNHPSPKNHVAETTGNFHQQQHERQEQEQQQQQQQQLQKHLQQQRTLRQSQLSDTDTVQITNVSQPSDIENMPLSREELIQIRWFIRNKYHQQMHLPSQMSSPKILDALSMDTIESEYAEFAGTTHAWTVFADDPSKRATTCDRYVGCIIIFFQIFTYYVFASEAIRDYKSSSVPVEISHDYCLASDSAPVENFTCEAMVTNNVDNIVAFFMLGIFLSADFLQAARAIRDAPFGTSASIFALLAGLEVFCAFLASTIAISYNLHIGELTDAIEVGVGLLFIRELSSRAYAGLRYKKEKQYRNFFFVVFLVVLIGFILDPVYEAMFVPIATE